jgi:hypothetical protein
VVVLVVESLNAVSSHQLSWGTGVRVVVAADTDTVTQDSLKRSAQTAERLVQGDAVADHVPHRTRLQAGVERREGEKPQGLMVGRLVSSLCMVCLVGGGFAQDGTLHRNVVVKAGTCGVCAAGQRHA